MKNIIICIKQVPDISQITVDPVNFTLDRGNAESIMNPMDKYALNAALELKKNSGFSLIAISMGPEKASDVLREALAFGADKAYLISDRSFSASDTWATSYILSKAIQLIGDFECILCGKQAVDGDTEQVPPSLSEHLHIPIIPYARKISYSNEKFIIENTFDTYNITSEINTPFVCTISKEFGELSLPSLCDWKRAFDTKINIINNKKLKLNHSKIGIKGSPTKVTSIKPVNYERKTTFINGSVKKQAEQLLKIIKLSPQKKDMTTSKLTFEKTFEYKKCIIVFGEYYDSKPYSIIFELASIGKKISIESKSRLILLAIGTGVLDTKDLGIFDEIHALAASKKDFFNISLMANEINHIILNLKPEIIIGGATPIGRMILPLIAVKQNTGLTADCTMLEYNEGLLHQIRPALGGNILATIKCENRLPQMCSVRPNVFNRIMPVKDSKPASIFHNEVKSTSNLIKKISQNNTTYELEDWKIVISGGIGLNKKGFERLKTLKNKLKFSLGASRAAVDAGWIPYYNQIGQSGRTIQPEIYIAIGISGAIQHIVGMKSSSIIIAINNDPEAPIFKIADFGIIADSSIILDEIERILNNE